MVAMRGEFDCHERQIVVVRGDSGCHERQICVVEGGYDAVSGDFMP